MIDLAQLEQQNGLPSGLLTAVMQQESGGNPNAVSPKGAMGAFQFMPQTAQQYGIDPNDPNQAAQGAAKMLGDLSQKYNGSMPHVLAGYNWGQGNVDRQGLERAPAETQNYISNIMGKIGSAIVPSAQASTPDAPSKLALMIEAESRGILPPDKQALLTEARSRGLLSSSTAPQQPGFFSRVGTDIENRNQMVQAATNRYSTDQQTLPETLLQATGKGVLGTANDIVGEGVKSAINYTPDFIKNPIAGLANQAMQTDIGKGAINLAKQGAQAYSDFSANHPRLTANLEAIGNVGLAAPLMKPIAEAAPIAGTALNKTGNALVNMAERQTANAKNSFVKDLILPKQTPSVAADQFSRSTEQGLFKSRVTQPTPQELDIINTVSQLPVGSNKSMLANYNIISSANETEAQNLIDRLKANDVAIPDDKIINDLSGIRANLAASPYITGDGASAADKVMNIALNKITENQQTASGLLQARKDFDAEIMRLKGAKTFDPSLDNPITTAVQQIRQGINNMVASAVPDAGVKASLRTQSNLYRAMDNIETKGASEGSNLFKRGIQKAANIIPLKGALAKTALALGATGVAAYAPAVALGAGAAYGTGRALGSAFLKRNLGKALTGTGKIMGGKK